MLNTDRLARAVTVAVYIAATVVVFLDLFYWRP